MERINDTLKKLGGSSGFQERYQRMKREVLENADVRTFLREQEDELTSEMIEVGMIKLYEYANQSKECNKCPNLESCINVMHGYHPKLVIIRGRIDIQYDRCPRKVMEEAKKKKEKLIQSLYVPKDILEASFNYMDIGQDRADAVRAAINFVKQYEPGKKQKGLYFYGEFGVGKSYILGAIANELSQKQISSMIVYVPELFREMKGSIADSTLNEKLESIKKEPILMLDDIGAETMSSWIRDEVLGPILQFRMLENLPTFFSSNFDFSGLEHHLTYTQRGEEEKMKAMRVMERIRYLAAPIHVKGQNKRL
ncbi:primosomal protein DnaI [Niallia sp. NCCP-28]|uniref:primosomal protein DnaI n=1 Tax=Niallia sp. NCCP-28 TaxID=2934712 RepID=UPI00208383EC|nr:primosomal protein DnaI [Niallia sp. NCCP-28]GKU81533.1 primosomal protein DnaI [Niallia sp. NCCP-28]